MMHPIMAEEYLRFAMQRHLQDAERWRRVRTVRRIRSATGTGWRAALRRAMRGFRATPATPATVAMHPSAPAHDVAARPPSRWSGPDSEQVERQLALTSGRH